MFLRISVRFSARLFEVDNNVRKSGTRRAYCHCQAISL
jgi:hypothetical protein